MTTRTENRTFDQHWTGFVSKVRPGLYSDADRQLAFCFYTWGWLDASHPIIEHLTTNKPEKLSELGVLGV